MAPRRVLYKAAQTPQTVVEDLFGLHVVFCGTSASSSSVEPGRVMGVLLYVLDRWSPGLHPPGEHALLRGEPDNC